MNGISAWNDLLARLDRFTPWLQDLFSLPNLVQIPAVLLTGAVAWLITRPVQQRLVVWVERIPADHRLDWFVQHREWVIHRLAPLIAPAVWAIGLWLSLIVAQQFGWPSAGARIGLNLLGAWLLIRLVADFVPYEALARLIAVFAWLVAALNIVHLLDPALALLDAAAIVVGGVRLSILTVMRGVVSLGILLWAAMFASRLFERRITGVPEITPRARVLLGKLIQITLVTLAVIVSLASIGIDFSTFALFTGALGIGLGLGLQKTVSNLFSGIVLLLDKSIKPGDVIEVGGTYGWVSSLGARYVSVETRDGMEYLIPNEDIITQQVLNWSHKSDRVRLKVGVRVPHDADLDQVLALLLEAVSRPPRVLPSPAPNALIMEFGESAIELQVRFWIEDAHNGVNNVKSQALYEIWRLFRQHGIRIPYPKRDLFIAPRSGNEAARPRIDPELFAQLEAAGEGLELGTSAESKPLKSVR
ncbi:MAG: mechanosensitive ion channel [Acidisphaera sp.]|nr:mechanosensitive ion channel [Acidisphaera sp.]